MATEYIIEDVMIMVKIKYSSGLQVAANPTVASLTASANEPIKNIGTGNIDGHYISKTILVNLIMSTHTEAAFLLCFVCKKQTI